MLIEPDWLNMLVEWGEKVTSLKLTKYDFAAAYLGVTVFIDEGADMCNSCGRKRTYPSAGLRATVLVYVVQANGYDFEAYE
jgi:hypothetical protein